jgi:hypothetical protein
MNELKKLETTQEAKEYFLKLGYDIPFWEIVEIIRNRNKRVYHKSTEEKAIKTFIQIWNGLLDEEPKHLTLKTYKIETILIDYLIWEIKNNKGVSYE